MPNRVVTSLWAEAKEGLRYVTFHPMILTVTGLVGVSSLFTISTMTLLPAWAVNILGGNAATNGLLQSARGLGALMGAITIAALGQMNFKGWLLTLGSFVFPITTLVFAAARWLPLSLAMLVGAGWSDIVTINLANVVVQTHTPDALRGRVMSVYSLVLIGSPAIGALLAGELAQQFGAPLAVVICAMVGLGGAVWVWFRVPQLRNA